MKKKCLLLLLVFFAAVQSYAIVFKNGNFLEFGVGATASWNTRIVDQSRYNRSNFVFKNFSPGLNLEVYTGKVDSFFSLFGKVSVMYPFGYTFNDVPLKYVNVLNLMADLDLGISLDIKLFDLLEAGLIPVLHYNFFWEDRFLYHTVGVGVGAQLRLKTVKRQKIVLEYFFTYDFADLGTNSLIEPLKSRFMHEVGIVYRF